MCVENGSAAHPASCTVGTDYSFPRGEVGGAQSKALAFLQCYRLCVELLYSWAPFVFMTWCEDTQIMSPFLHVTKSIVTQ